MTAAAPGAPADAGGSRRPGSGLFRRIFVTFVVTVIASAAVASVGAYVFASRFSADWVADTTDVIEDGAQAIVGASDDPSELRDELRVLSERLDANVTLYRHGKGKIRGKGKGKGKLAGPGPARPPPPIRKRRRELRRGQSVVFRESRFGPPSLAVMLPDDGARRDILLVAQPRRRRTWAIPLISFSLLVTVIGAGSWVLARSLATRLSRLQAGAGRIAGGDLTHRITTEADRPADEIDDLSFSFNHMAERVEVLVTGQKTLLANVSHELRTPIARVKVLLEILEERVGGILSERGDPHEHAARLHKGMAEMSEDIVEIESLIGDLLTSGRLDLQRTGSVLETGLVKPAELVDRVARKVGARVLPHDVREITMDAMLIERLLSNLLANARRACPDGEITIECVDHGDTLAIAVEDEGTGVKVADRSAIFEPFMRLDAARDRDRGGVGLGLYLCRQIATAHGGTIEIGDRRDGGKGARFVLTLPAD